jgi:hypothetical protein
LKGPWESRVGLLLDPALYPEDFAYSFKPADSALYGGQPRIDWLAADYLGRFWMIEVKHLPENRKSINLLSEVSAGQRAALNALGLSAFGLPVLAIGQGSTLHVFAWRDVVAWIATGSSLLPLTETLVHLDWSGPKAWKRRRLVQIAQEQGWFRSSIFPFVLAGSVSPATSPVPSNSSASSTSIPEPRSPSTWKRPVSIRTRPRTKPSAP